MPGAFNPNFRPPPPDPLPDPELLFESLAAGNRRALARSITLVESARQEDQELAGRLLDLALEHEPDHVRVGVTGVPGVGKSTFIETLGMRLVEDGHRLAVLAVDPTSESTRGSILGDKSRMARLASDPRAFVRPSPTSGALGGVAHRTREAAQLCAAAGFDVVLIETVGVGQSEVAVRRMVDAFLLLLLPGSGDELQGIKRGVMETADVLSVTKCDGDNLQRAEATRAQAESALRLMAFGPEGRPATTVCSALTGDGVAEVWAAVEGFLDRSRREGRFLARRAEQAVAWMDELVRQAVESRWFGDSAVQARRADLAAAVREHRLTPRRAAATLMEGLK